jgi:hypothetical protein
LDDSVYSNDDPPESISSKKPVASHTSYNNPKDMDWGQQAQQYITMGAYYQKIIICRSL